MATPFRPYRPDRPILRAESKTTLVSMAKAMAVTPSRVKPMNERAAPIPVYVQFSVIRQVVVNDQGHLRDIQPPGPDIC